MKTSRRKLGDMGESVAAKFLIQKGLQLIDRNIHAPGGELDLILKDGDEFVFVEVKTRASHAFGAARESFTSRKAQRMLAAIEHYFLARQQLEDIPPFRIDFVAVEVRNGRFFCEYFPCVEIP